ncbi:MAG: YihY/virulence factor BrkB family protein [Acidobacteria bacterium]|nr:YihY/virulence factor BrkB family protein [Acidobacteriota bacterium]
MQTLWINLRRAMWKAFGHNAFATAKAAAYSAILSIFPAVLVATSLLALTPETSDASSDIRAVFSDLLPPDTMGLLQNYFQTSHARPWHLAWSAAAVSVLAAMGFMLSLMEGFRQAYGLPRDFRGFWRERLVAFALIPSTLVPMMAATAFVVFGHQIELWMVDNSGHNLQLYVLFVWRILRWLIAIATSITVLAVVYHFALPRAQHWRRVVPGALLSTISWFAATMLYGWYVTRFADYSKVYGSFGAGVATMVWLYMVSLSILLGSEFNAQLFPLPRTIGLEAPEGEPRRGAAYASIPETGHGAR